MENPPRPETIDLTDDNEMDDEYVTTHMIPGQPVEVDTSKNEMLASFEKMRNDNSVIYFFYKFKDRDYITNMEQGVFEEVFVQLLSNKNINLKYVTRFLAHLCRLPHIGQFIRQIFEGIYLRGNLDIYLEINSGDEYRLIAASEAIGFTTVQLYMENVLAEDVIKKILVTLSSPSTVASFPNILHLRIIFIIIMFLPREFPRCDRELWLPRFSENLSIFFLVEIRKFEKQQPANPRKREYRSILETTLAFLRKSAKTKRSVVELDNLRREGMNKYMKKQWEYNEKRKEEITRVYRERWEESQRMFQRMHQMKREIIETSDEEHRLSLLIQLDAMEDMAKTFGDQRSVAFDEINNLEKLYTDGKNQFNKYVTDLFTPHVRVVAQSSTSSQ